MDTGTLLTLGIGAFFLSRRTPTTPAPGTPGVIPGTTIPTTTTTTPVVPGTNTGTAPAPGSVVVSPGAGTAAPSAGVATLGGAALTVLQIGKIAQSAMKEAAKLFRTEQEGGQPFALSPETRAAWESYRAGEWHVASDGTVVIDLPAAPVLNAGFTALTNPQILDAPVLVPSDYSLLTADAAAAGLTGAYSLNVDLSLAFTPETTQANYSLLAHEEMRAYLEALPPDQANGFVTDAASLTGYSTADVLQGLNALGLLAGALGIYQGIQVGDPISILGGVAGVISNFMQLAGAGQLPGLSVLTGVLGIVQGAQTGNIFAIVSGTIGVITGVITLAEAGVLGATAAAIVATEIAVTIIGILSIVTIVLLVVGFMISHDMQQKADQYAAEIREHAEIVQNMQIAWPQLVQGHKAATLLRFVPVLPPARHVEALRAIFGACHVGIGAGAAISRFLGAGGQGGPFGTGDVSAYEAVSGTYSDDCIIGAIRTEEALLRLGRLVEPGFYPLGIMDPAETMWWLSNGMGAYGPLVMDPVSGEIVRGTAAPNQPYGYPSLLDAIFPPTIPPTITVLDDSGMPYTYPNLNSPASGWRDLFWRGVEEEMFMKVIAYYNPNWEQTLMGQRFKFLGTYPVPLDPVVEDSMRRQFQYLVTSGVPPSSGGPSGFYPNAPPDHWYDPAFIVPARAFWPDPYAGY